MTKNYNNILKNKFVTQLHLNSIKLSNSKKNAENIFYNYFNNNNSPNFFYDKKNKNSKNFGKNFFFNNFQFEKKIENFENLFEKKILTQNSKILNQNCFCKKKNQEKKNFFEEFFENKKNEKKNFFEDFFGDEKKIFVFDFKKPEGNFKKNKG